MAAEREQPVSLADRRAEKRRREYARLVLDAYDDFEHADRRTFLDRKAELEREARRKL